MITDEMRQYIRRSFELKRHYERYVRYVERYGFACQECGGAGGEIEPVTDCGEGPWIACGWCEGAGKVTKWRRGEWLRYKKALKRERER